MSFERGPALSPVGGPNTNGPIFATRDEDIFAGEPLERDAAHRRGMPLEGLSSLSSIGRPDAHGLVVATGRDHILAREFSDCYSSNRPDMTFERLATTRPVCSPDPDLPVRIPAPSGNNHVFAIECPQRNGADWLIVSR